mgnify:FL=1
MGNALNETFIQDRAIGCDARQMITGLQEALNLNARWYLEREIPVSKQHKKARSFYVLALNNHLKGLESNISAHTAKGHSILENDAKPNVPPVPDFEMRHIRRLEGK